MSFVVANTTTCTNTNDQCRNYSFFLHLDYHDNFYFYFAYLAFIWFISYNQLLETYRVMHFVEDYLCKCEYYIREFLF